MANWADQFQLSLVENGIPQVTLQQKKGQQVRATSRCLWDPHADAVTHAYYDSETMYCICAACPSYLSLFPSTAISIQTHRNLAEGKP